MKPLPAQNSEQSKFTTGSAVIIPVAELKSAAPRTTGNPCASQRAYPWLLMMATVVSGVFCFLYITKPVIFAAPIPTLANLPFPSRPVDLTPEPSRPPEPKTIPVSSPAAPPKPRPTPPPVATFEQTNLRIQHILSAETPGGGLAKIDLEVPVLYQSRNLRWTTAEVVKARELLVQLEDYQEKSRELRAQGTELLAGWNQMVENSIPIAALRADSPTLPINQADAAGTPHPVNLDTNQLIKIQPATK